MKTVKKSSTPEQLNQKFGMTTFAGTDTQLQLHSNHNLLDEVQESLIPGYTGYTEASKTRD